MHWTTSNPVMADNLRDMRDAVGDASNRAAELTGNLAEAAVHEALGYELASELEDVLARASMALSRAWQEHNDSLGASA